MNRGNERLVTSWYERLHSTSVQALYLHVPFCARKCSYCDFTSWATRRDDAVLGRYVDTLCVQLDEAHELGLLTDCRTAYVGGGTPTLLGPQLLGTLINKVRAVTPSLAELTVEANPDSLSDEVIAALVHAGTTRLSIGVQSLNDEELKALGRLHDARTACERVRAAVASGLDVSLDLMCATPAQTAISWKTTLEKALDLGVGHVSVYPLQIEEGTPLEQALDDDEPAWNDPSVQAERMEQAEEALCRAGMERYEVASYARSGKSCLHNQAYWTGRPYLGLGTGASSLLTREAYEALRSSWTALPAPENDTMRIRLTVTSGPNEMAADVRLSALHAEVEFLNESQATAEDLMLGMRLSRGIGPGLLERAYLSIGTTRVDEALATCEKRGLIARKNDRFVPTHDGWLLGNELYGLLWDLAEESVHAIQV